MDLEAEAKDLVRRLQEASQTVEQEADAPAHEAERLLLEAKAELDPSSATGQAFLDVVGMDLPFVLVRFTRGPCQESAEALLNFLLDNSDPRDMFTAYMEALQLYSDSDSLRLCPALLNGLAKILTKLRRRRTEYFRDSLLCLFNVAVASANTHDTWKILDGLVHIVLVVLDIAANEVVTEQKQGLHEALSILILVLLENFSEIERQLDGSSTTESSMLQLARILPACGLSYVDMIMGSMIERITDLLEKELESGSGFIRAAMQGGAIAVWWRFCFDKASSDNVEAAIPISGKLKSSSHAVVSALCNVCMLLSSMERSQKRVAMGIDLLTLILEWGTESSEGNLVQVQPVILDGNELIEINKLIQVLENVIIFSPLSRTRQNAYHVLVNIIRKILPDVERFATLKFLILQSEHPSMISLLLYIMKEEISNAISSKRETQGQSLNSPFASEAVLEIIAFILQPPSGGPPELPAQTNAVLSALNLYRFVLIKEASGNSNYTGILLHARLEEACLKWLQPLRTYLEGFKRNFSDADPEVTSGVLLSISNIEGVLYRCLELAEPLLKKDQRR